MEGTNKQKYVSLLDMRYPVAEEQQTEKNKQKQNSKRYQFGDKSSK